MKEKQMVSVGAGKNETAGANCGSGTNATTRVWVDTYAGHGRVEMPRRFRLDVREIEVIDNLDQWHGPHDRYFEVKGDDRNLYILRLDEIRAEADYVPKRAISDSSSGLPSKQRARWWREDVACG